MSDLRNRLKIKEEALEAINALILDPGNGLIDALLAIVDGHGGPEAINRAAQESRQPSNLLRRLEQTDSPYLADLRWLTDQRDRGAFISVQDFRRKVLGAAADRTTFKDEHAVTLEISALQYFPFLIAEALLHGHGRSPLRRLVVFG